MRMVPRREVVNAFGLSRVAVTALVLVGGAASAQDGALPDDAAPDETQTAPAPAAGPEGAAPEGAAPEGAPPEKGEHGDPRYAVDVEQPADAVIRELVAAAKAGDLPAYQEHLAARFRHGVEILQRQPAPEGAEAWAWPVFLKATAADLTSVEVVQFYERATVRAETADGRTIKFRLVVESGAWKVDLPEPLEQLVAERAPPAPEAPPAEPPGEDAPDPAAPVASGPTPGQGGVLEGSRPVEPPPVVPPPPAKPQPLEEGFFSPGGPGHYVWYIPDYLFLASSAVVFGFGLTDGIAPPWILIGPDYNMADPKPDAFYDPRLDGVIGRPMLQEKVPVWAVAGAFGAGVVGLGGLDVVRHVELHHTHAFVVGALTSMMLTLSATEALKLGVGRLRPDFRERYERSACSGYVEAPGSFDCTRVPDDGFEVSRDDVIDGMKSFPSGHASTAFSAATYLSLYLGGEYLWGKNARPWTMPIAAASIGLLYAAAGFTAATRLSDNRHHFEDVAVGAGLGSAIAAGTYFLHFDLDGDARWRTFRLSAAPVQGQGGAVSLSGTF